MSDNISRQAALDAVSYETFECYEARKAIRALPSADRTGHWIDETFEPCGLVYHPYKCDQCGEHSEADSNYCPNCGADMRGEKDE